MKFRRALLWLHRWAGILAGLVILVIAVTGGAPVFERQLERWISILDAHGQHLRAASDAGGFAGLRRARPQVFSGFVLWWKRV